MIVILLNNNPLFPANLIPYKDVTNIEINKLLIAIPTIDRDIDISMKIYNNLITSLSCYTNYNIIVVTRETDIQTINFWKNKATIITVEHYEILKRHNYHNIKKKYNIMREYCIQNNYDALFILESDILLNVDSIKKHLINIKNNHVTLSYFNVPWCGYPYITVVEDLFPKDTDARDSNNILILGHGTGAIMIRKEVLENIEFKIMIYNGIKGQDIGFFKQCYEHRYKVFLIDDYVEHLYNRNTNSSIIPTDLSYDDMYNNNDLDD